MSEATKEPMICVDCGGTLTYDDLLWWPESRDPMHIKFSDCITSLNERLSLATQRAAAAEVERDALRTRAEAAEAERDRLHAAVERVRALHKPINAGLWAGKSVFTCPVCDYDPHPCKTIRALDGDV